MNTKERYIYKKIANLEWTYKNYWIAELNKIIENKQKPFENNPENNDNIEKYYSDYFHTDIIHNKTTKNIYIDNANFSEHELMQINKNHAKKETIRLIMELKGNFGVVMKIDKIDIENLDFFESGIYTTAYIDAVKLYEQHNVNVNEKLCKKYARYKIMYLRQHGLSANGQDKFKELKSKLIDYIKKELL